jgi:prophage DNA circulation protein
MAWQEKTLEAKYTSPSGKEIPFLWEKTSRETELKTGVFTFPDRDGAHVQHQGRGATSFPMKCIFSGPDCMDKADEFEAALFEQDVAELQHPVYGLIKVIPTGNIKREDDLISALNESCVTVTFTETITDEEATPMDTVTADEIDETYEEFSESSAADFAEGISTDTVAEELQLQSNLMAQAQILDDNLIPLSEVDPSALANIKTISGELKGSIKNLKKDNWFMSAASWTKKMAKLAESYVVKALNVARLVLNLMKLPSKISVNIMEKIKGYSMIATNLINQFRNDPFGIKNVANAYKSTSLVLSGCVAALASGSAVTMASIAATAPRASVNRTPTVSPSGGSSAGGGASGGGSPSGGTIPGGPGTIAREETAQIISGILTLFEEVKSFQDSKIEKDVFIDSDSNTSLLLSKLVYSSVNLIMAASLSLPMRRTITLDQDRQVIELVCELYGSEDYLDKFIAENDLSLDELEVIPMGREVSYYVQVA